MEAKDTVMSADEMTRANEEAHLSPFANPYQEKCVIARAQAEISFKAGIREVVEWGETPCIHYGTVGNKWLKRCCDECWQAKLKEWGIE